MGFGGKRFRPSPLARQYGGKSYKQKTEIKHVDTGVAGVDYSAGGTAYDLTFIAEGSDSTYRTGRRINLKNLNFHFTGTAGGSTNAITSVRVALIRVIGKYSGTFTDYMPTYGTAISADKCHLIFDRLDTLTNDNNNNININTSISLKGRMVKYSGINGGDECDGALYMLVMADAVGATKPTYTGVLRTWFTDA